ncbi:MAG: hypothetical protein LBB78_04840 [Spirochaetaceae bacterium]|jgi:dienelactone hydrolase|nr:hypothetical protein [Spirochaetaceae bacterium]
MGELRILEGLVVFLIILPLLRSFFIKLESIDGLLFLPFVSFCITIAIFPAYGFRPECIPLLLYTFSLTIAYITPVFTLLKHSPLDIIPEKRSVFAIAAAILLVPTAGIAFFFTPSQETGLVSEGVFTRKVYNLPEKTEFMLRIYGSGEGEAPGGARRPLMLLVPPIAGSVSVIDQVCLKLWERGFTVISYSRLFDISQQGEGGPYGTSIAAVYRLFRVHTRGFKLLSVNTAGRALEAERIKEIQFLLSYIQADHRGDSVFAGVDTANIFIAGYGIGGGALTQLAGSPGFNRTNPGVKGIIAVEGPIFSAFTGEEPPPQAAGEDLSWFRSLRAGIVRWFSRWRPLRITGLGVVPRPEVPALYLVSDKAPDPRYRDTRYAAVFQALHGSREPAVLAAVPGAGILDYTDIPEKFPFYRVLFPGKKQSPWDRDRRDFVKETAAMMTNFAVLFLENSPALPRREQLGQDIYLETGGAWNFRNPRSILEL